MRFGKKFQRRVGAGTLPVLGSDAAPTGKPSDKSVDNQLSWKLNNIVGFPVERIAVAYSATGAGSSLPATLYVYDDLTDAWYVSSSGTLLFGKIAYFDVPVLGDSTTSSAGALEVCLVVAAAGGDAAGTYTFSIGADLSNDGSSISAGAGNATAANQATGNASLASIDTKTPAKGAAASAAAEPVTIATDQWDATNAALPVVQKPLAVSTYAWTAKSITTALATNLVVKASTGVLRSASWRVDATAPTGTYYVQYFDAAALPGEGTATAAGVPAPIKVQHVSGRDDFVSDDFTDSGVGFATGIVACLSTTEFTKTIAGAYLTGTGLFK